MRIHVKLIGFVAGVLLVPFLIGVIYIDHFGKAYYQKQQGILYLTIAEELADTLQTGIKREFRHILDWVEISPVAALSKEYAAVPLDMGEVSLKDTAWPNLTEQDPTIQEILSNPLSDYLRVFNGINPWFAEIIVTDRHGRLTGATNKSTDYWQADEPWWQKTSTFPSGKGYLSSIQKDESAGVLAIDIATPVYSKDSSSEFLGVLKTSLNIKSILRQAAPSPWNKEISRNIFFPDGRLLTRIDGETIPGASSLSPTVLQQLTESRGHWTTAEIIPGKPALVASVTIRLTNEEVMEAPPELIVVVCRDLDVAMMPVRNTLHQLTLYAVFSLIILAVASYLIATHWFAQPLEQLRGAALSIVKHIKQSEQGQFEEMWESRQAAAETLADLESIQTKDEIQELSEDFIRMGRRVLNFQRQMERELMEKTEEIHSDLLMAREFQTALLPQDIPDMSAIENTSRYNLHFSHIYRPALSVSGDFFDISKISEHRVRVFIADVMGHGARSALMTAILHALLHSIEKTPEKPSRLLQRMNEEFFAIGNKTNETVFVTAVHLIIDTFAGVIRYASAGHPAPLVLDRETGDVRLLPIPGKPPAVGLIEDFTYEDSEMDINSEQTLLLYTDGATEAMNPKQEEFGQARLIETVRKAHEYSELDNLSGYILENLETFMDSAPALDDICLISAGLTRPNIPSNPDI
ncbi:SpoIIE family protein phosphatase [Tichowtungia aerotolerans]|uniref:SpoIIE family protein phosphatase n=1 Tax=Tichowtungia aerotolerans TaxID=2697043 RepID=A0A6P1M178_9BACT|nr:SpoIIE family protein phosphatase [Tichowtungia aerotolerans]QHI68330.1 SpoIIE family protein phosphatase [Tichowtungia aerotolerans]